MPSRAAHRAALRRSKEPSAVPPPELAALPALPEPWTWLNPVVGNDYVRTTWHAVAARPHGTQTAVVITVAGGDTWSVTMTDDCAPSTRIVPTAREAFDIAVAFVRGLPA